MHPERSYTHKNKEDILTNPKDSESIIKDGKEVFNFFFFFPQRPNCYGIVL